MMMMMMKKNSNDSPPSLVTTMTMSLFLMVTMFVFLTLNVTLVVGEEQQQQQQLITYRDTPFKIWEARIPSVRKGNGVFLSNSYHRTTLVSTSQDGSISGFHPGSGTNWFSYRPSIMQNSNNGEIPVAVSSNSGMTFVAPTSTDNSHTIDYDYMIYSIMENENSAKPMT